MPDWQESTMNKLAEVQAPQCQFFVVRKKRLCRMTVRPGRHYCGEHEPQPKLDSGENDTRIPCPNDPKHTCYASKLSKHLAICNAREGEQPAYIERGVNAPAPPPGAPPRRALAHVPADALARLIHKVNAIYEKHIKDNISSVEEHEIHPVVLPEYAEAGRADSSLRHLRQASSLLWLAQDQGLVHDSTCYVELGAGKGHLSYYAWRAWCAGARGSRVLLLDRASLRHKRDNKLRTSQPDPAAPSPEHAERAPGEAAETCTRLRADLADVVLSRVPAVRAAAHVVGFAKHLCGVATDYALRCVTEAAARGAVLATCCHHRCDAHGYFGLEHLMELGIEVEEMDILFGIVSWGTCGDGRPRARRRDADRQEQDQAEAEAASRRRSAGARAKALLDWGRVLRLRARGYRAGLARFVPAAVSPENIAIVAVRQDAALPCLP